jgi:hypothetical protein
VRTRLAVATFSSTDVRQIGLPRVPSRAGDAPASFDARSTAGTETRALAPRHQVTTHKHRAVSSDPPNAGTPAAPPRARRRPAAAPRPDRGDRLLLQCRRPPAVRLPTGRVDRLVLPTGRIGAVVIRLEVRVEEAHAESMARPGPRVVTGSVPAVEQGVRRHPVQPAARADAVPRGATQGFQQRAGCADTARWSRYASGPSSTATPGVVSGRTHPVMCTNGDAEPAGTSTWSAAPKVHAPQSADRQSPDPRPRNAVHQRQRARTVGRTHNPCDQRQVKLRAP